ncbi:lytic tail protein [Paraconexibacter sp. AEG42_29]|uniref:Lytic tail protein n=1 Tax=Paraconexibacter sp. AEG42_29 TaxID=2997339 RepID=A0AAU7ANM7_9ACTN
MTAMAVQRVAELHAMFAALQAPPAPVAAPTTSFAGVLDEATAATASAAPAVVPAPTVAAGSTPYAAEIDAAAAKYGLDPALLRGLVKQESGFDPNARSSAGATGLTQLMPATARSLGVTDATDPAQALDGGANYLKQQLDRFGGDASKALAAYNAGPGAVQKYGGIPPYAETQAYVQKVLAFAEQFRAQGVAAAAPAPAALAVPAAATAAAAGSSAWATSPGVTT